MPAALSGELEPAVTCAPAPNTTDVSARIRPSVKPDFDDICSILRNDRERRTMG
jgi:hypothetical protein